MSNCCDSSYYRTPFNVNYQNLYCNLAQSADTNLQNVITSGWSYNKLSGKMAVSEIPSVAVKNIKENYCNCVSRLVNTPMVMAYKEDSRFC